MTDWQPIEAAPEKTWLLTYSEWHESKPVGLSMYENREVVKQTVEHESTNAKGLRRIVQYETANLREWSGDHWDPSHWMPLPPPPVEKT